MTRGPDVTFREARREDLDRLVALLADDPLGASRESVEDTAGPGYVVAFDAIQRDAQNELIIAEHDGNVVGVLQLTFIPGLTYQGGTRAQIEGVRIARELRGSGIGRMMLGWAIARAGERGCRLVQLTTDKRRSRALRFYESLGFEATHEGMKLHLG